MRKRLTYLRVIYELTNMRYLVMCRKYLTNIGHSLVELGSICEMSECIFYDILENKRGTFIRHLLIKMYEVFMVFIKHFIRMQY